MKISKSIQGIAFAGALALCAASGASATTTVGDGWGRDIKNMSTGVWTIDPSGSETVNGQATFNVYPGESFRLICDGTGFSLIGLGTGLVLMDTKVGSASAALDFTRFDSNRFAKYEFIFDGVYPVTAGDGLWMRASTNGGSSFDTAASYASGILYALGTANGALQNLAQTKIDLTTTQGNDPGYAISGRVGVSVLAAWTYIDSTHVSVDNTSLSRREIQVSGQYSGAANALRFLYSTGNLNGTIRQYGYTK
ncbi:hypothetical protein AB7828_03850 [Tardiphaga sp. 215_C5_N2_1]|uniref:hypothetical protein n=1 Tax=Tardiphaga sp. 215_C5_N2_1 TaxID=3240774 RepID=UPI003F8951E1